MIDPADWTVQLRLFPESARLLDASQGVSVSYTTYTTEPRRCEMPYCTNGAWYWLDGRYSCERCLASFVQAAHPNPVTVRRLV